MAKVVTPITATVEFITGIKQGNYGEYRSVLFKDSTGEKIWKSFAPEAEELTLLSKGAKVQLIPAGISKNGNEKHNIVLLQDSPSQASRSSTKPLLQNAASKTQPVAELPPPKRPETVPPTWETAEKQELSAKLCDHADLLKFSYEVVKHKFAGIADPRDYRAIATTLYLTITRQQTDLF